MTSTEPTEQPPDPPATDPTPAPGGTEPEPPEAAQADAEPAPSEGPRDHKVLALVGDRILGFPSVIDAVQSHAVGLATHIFTAPGQFYQLGRLRHVNQFFEDAPELLVPEGQNRPEHLQALWAHLQGKAIAAQAYKESEMAGKKKEKEPKAARAPSNGDGRRNKNSEKRITVLAEGNPKREGTATYGRFKLYKDGMTVAEFLKKGGTSADVTYDVEHKFIELHD